MHLNRGFSPTFYTINQSLIYNQFSFVSVQDRVGRSLQAVLAGAYKLCGLEPTSYAGRSLQAMLARAYKLCGLEPTSHAGWSLQAMLARAYKPCWSLEVILKPNSLYCNLLIRECPLLRKGSFYFYTNIQTLQLSL
jgi:hypothetical protein